VGRLATLRGAAALALARVLAGAAVVAVLAAALALATVVSLARVGFALICVGEDARSGNAVPGGNGRGVELGGKTTGEKARDRSAGEE